MVNVPGSVTFSYIVKNIGDTPLSNVLVMDDRLTGAIGSSDALAVNESKTFTKVVDVANMHYPKVNRGTVTAADPLNKTVTDFDDAEIKLVEVQGIQLTQPATLPRTGSGSPNMVLPAAALVALGIGLRRMSRRSNKVA